jgi:hypothetical protein
MLFLLEGITTGISILSVKAGIAIYSSQPQLEILFGKKKAKWTFF